MPTSFTPAQMNPLILSGFGAQPLAKEISGRLGSKMVKVNRRQFNGKEIQLTLESNVRGHEVVVIGSPAGDPNKQEKEARLMMSAARRAGARKITLVLPYMWYGRGDDSWNGRRLPSVVDTIETLRGKCDNVIVVDPHNATLTREKFLDGGGPVETCTVVHLAFPYAVQLKQMVDDGILSQKRILFTHADAGSVKRIDSAFRRCMYDLLGFQNRDPQRDDWAQGFKDRDKATSQSETKGVSLRVRGKDVVIFEDMVDSGGTACKIAKLLKDKGARSVTLFATNGLFTADVDGGEKNTAAIERINKSAIDALFIADTYDYSLINPELFAAIKESPVIHVIKSAPYIASIVNALHLEVGPETGEDDNSIMALLNGTHPLETRPHQDLARPVALKLGNNLLALNH